MAYYILRRMLGAPLVLLMLATISFFIMRAAPGGPFDAERKVPPRVEQALKAQYHLDKNLLSQYLIFLRQLMQGNLGPSFKYPGRSVNEIIADRLPPSLYLGGYALVLALLMGSASGILGAVRHNSAFDYTAMATAMVGLSVPTFVVAPVLILVFQTHLRWISPPGDAGPSFAYVSLAAFTLALPFAARIARLARAGMLEIMHQNFIRTARAKGMREVAVVMRHALWGGITPVISFLGPAVAAILTGSLVVETVFMLKGLGYEFVYAAINRDYTLVMGTVIVYGTLLIVFNLIADIILGLLDPRLRYD